MIWLRFKMTRATYLLKPFFTLCEYGVMFPYVSDDLSMQMIPRYTVCHAHRRLKCGNCGMQNIEAESE